MQELRLIVINIRYLLNFVVQNNLFFGRNYNQKRNIVLKSCLEKIKVTK